jgi:hypothetical protein
MSSKDNAVFLKGREGDVFISYGSLDDATIAGNEGGWITIFENDLRARVNQVLGERARIWRDKNELRGNAELATLKRVLQNTGAILTVVSPSFIKSDWCKREVEFFCEADGGRLNAPGTNEYRIFKVVKIPVPRELLFPELQPTLEYHFFEKSNQGHTIELGPSSDQKRKELYESELYRLAADIGRVLEIMRGTVPVVPRATVYLAETTPDLREVRNRIADDLKQRNYEVLPNIILDRDSANYRSQVTDFLQRSALSIHLLGERYGSIPEGEKESHVAVQAELAAERCCDPHFRRVIWMPPDLKPLDDPQKSLITFLENDTRAQTRTEVVQKRIEHLKEDLLTWLSQIPSIEEQKAAAAARASQTPRVYIVATGDELKSGAVDPLIQAASAQGFEVVFPPISGDPAVIKAAHHDDLENCSACIVYFAAADDAWARERRNEIEVRFAKKPFPAAFYIVGSESPFKRFFSASVPVFHEQQTFNPNSLAPFFEAVRKASGTA